MNWVRLRKGRGKICESDKAEDGGRRVEEAHDCERKMQTGAEKTAIGMYLFAESGKMRRFNYHECSLFAVVGSGEWVGIAAGSICWLACRSGECDDWPARVLRERCGTKVKKKVSYRQCSEWMGWKWMVRWGVCVQDGGLVEKGRLRICVRLGDYASWWMGVRGGWLGKPLQRRYALAPMLGNLSLSW